MGRVLLYHAIRWVLRGIPLSWGVGLAKFIFRTGYWFCAEKRRTVRKNLSVVCPEGSLRALAKEVFASFGRYLIEFLSSPSQKECLAKKALHEGLEHLRRAYAQGRGVISVTAHLGNWEMAAYLAVKQGFNVSAVYLTHPDPRLNRIFMEQRQLKDLEVIPWKEDATRRSLAALRSGRVLAIAGDVDFPGTGIEAEFFGRPARIPRGPAVLARRTGAPIVPGCYVWENDHARFMFDEPIRPQGLSEHELSGRVAAALEKMIGAYPGQWICFERVW